MLDGEAGPQRRQIDELVQFLVALNPDAVCFSNALLVGALRTLKAQFAGPVFCVLQGDDIFLETLPEPHRTQAIATIRARAQQFDGFLTHTAYYRDFMAGYLGLPAERFHQLPLTIDPAGHDGRPERRENGRFTVGYFARICPEKGPHQLVDAFRILHAKHPQTVLRAGGYLGKRDARYFRELQRSARDLGDAFQYVGSPGTHAEKVRFLKSLDVLSVPTIYREPKGLYVLEALANGVPVVQPRHGSFPELIEATQGGLLVEPGNPHALADALERLLLDRQQRHRLAAAGHAKVRQHFSPEALAAATLAAIQRSTIHASSPAPPLPKGGQGGLRAF